MDILKNIRIQRVAPNDAAATTFTLAAGTTDVNSVSVDTQNFETCAFLVHLGAIVATGTIGLQVQGSANGSTNWTNIAGAVYNGTADTDDDKIVALEVNKPLFRFLRVAIDRGTANSTIDSITALLDGPHSAPVSLHATVEAAVTV